jgi:hypothetical protein
MLAGDHFVALCPQRGHDLVETRTVGPQSMGKHDAGLG